MSFLLDDNKVLEHYIRRWGKPITIHTFDSAEVSPSIRPLYIAVFSLPGDGLAMYASIGMSRAGMLDSETNTIHYAEIFMGVYEHFESLPKIMAMLATYPHNEKTFVAPEHTIPLGMPIVQNSSLTSVLFAIAYFDPPWFRGLDVDGKHIQFLWVIPLTEREREFKTKTGWNALGQMFENEQVVIGDVFRESAIR